jgi:hypothetical protein
MIRIACLALFASAFVAAAPAPAEARSVRSELRAGASALLARVAPPAPNPPLVNRRGG